MAFDDDNDKKDKDAEDLAWDDRQDPFRPGNRRQIAEQEILLSGVAKIDSGQDFDHILSLCQDLPRCFVVDVSPRFAKFLLRRNECNRIVSDANVKKLKHDILNGSLVLNGENIIISKEGMLNDGQHRCLAIVEADRPVRTMVVFGVARETRITLDQGMTRTTSHYFAMAGYKYAGHSATLTRYILSYRAAGTIEKNQSKPITKSDLNALMSDERDIIYSVIESTPNGISNQLGGRPLLAFCLYTFSKGWSVHTEVATSFIRMLADGHNLSEGDPILVARNRLMQKNNRLKPNEKAEIIFRAWNHWRRGNEKIKQIPARNGKLPSVE